MLEEVEFLFDNQLILAVETLIRKSKNKLVLISPFIDLDARIKEALKEKISSPNFELKVLFGKNEQNYLKSIKRDSLEFLKKFPNVEIRYNERLHAKFYQNDFEYIITSINLYDYSLANNIEVGVKIEYGAKGLLGKAIETTTSVIGQGIDLVKHAVLGVEKDLNVVEKFNSIFELSELKYKTQPVLVEKNGIQGIIGMKKLEDIKVVKDTLTSMEQNDSLNSINTQAKIKAKIEVAVTTTITESKCLSASQLSQMFGVQRKEITSLMQRKGLINGDKITEQGKVKGLVIKTFKGKEYIAYPQGLDEFKEFKN